MEKKIEQKFKEWLNSSALSKEEKQELTRGEILKMFSLLLLHTIIITIILLMLKK